MPNLNEQILNKATIAATSAKPAQGDAKDAALILAKNAIEAAHEESKSAELQYAYKYALAQIDKAKPVAVQGEPVATSEATVMFQLAESIAASAHPEEDSRLEVAYAIARHLKLDWPSAVQSDHEIRHWAEEYECAMKCLDDAGVPKADSSEKVYSLWGRIKAYTTPQPASSANPAPGYCKNCKDYTIEEPLFAQAQPATSAKPKQRPESILSAMGDLVFDSDDGYEELLESLVQTEQPATVQGEPVAYRYKDALNQAAIGLATLLEGQSNPVKPTIHEYGQASRALIAIRAAIASQKGGQS